MVITLAIIGFSALIALIIYFSWRREIQHWLASGSYKQSKFLIIAIIIAVLAVGLTLYFVLSTNRSPEVGLAGKPVSESSVNLSYTLELGTKMPPLSLPDTENDIVDLSVYADRILVLSFSNSQCQYCPQQLKELQELHSLEGDDTKIVIINVLEPAATAKDYKRQAAIEFPVLVDSTGSTLTDYQIKGIPTTFFIHQGVICGLLQGEVSVAEIRESIAACRSIFPDKN
jgi:peroxiredoxin